MCPRRSDPLYVVSYYIKSVTSSWTYSSIKNVSLLLGHTYILLVLTYTICPGSSDPFYKVSYYIKWVTTSWTHGMYIDGLDTQDIWFLCARPDL